MQLGYTLFLSNSERAVHEEEFSVHHFCLSRISVQSEQWPSQKEVEVGPHLVNVVSVDNPDILEYYPG